MLYLLATFWFWLLLVLALGIGVGWLTFGRDGAGGWRGLVPWGVALGGGVLLAVLQVLPQRIGYWLDLGVLMLAVYLVGCCLAALIRHRLSAVKAEPPMRTDPVMTPSVAAKEVPVEPMKSAVADVPTEASEEAITGLSAPRGGKPDDLTRIYGVDAEVEKKLNALGLYHYGQLASLTPGNRRWLFRQLGHEGRFPSWWWRWRYDAEQLVAGQKPSAPQSGASKPAKAKPAAKSAPPPVPAPAMAKTGNEDFEGTKPAGLVAPRGGKADDLKRIGGIGKQNEGRLHGLGVWHFEQIAAWSPDEITWVGGYLAFPGRIEREDWVGQAKALAKGEDTEFSKRADAGKVATSLDDTSDDGQSNVIVLKTSPVANPKKNVGKSATKAPEKPGKK